MPTPPFTYAPDVCNCSVFIGLSSTISWCLFKQKIKLAIDKGNGVEKYFSCICFRKTLGALQIWIRFVRHRSNLTLEQTKTSGGN